MKVQRILILCWALLCAFGAVGQTAAQEAVRPSGVPESSAKSTPAPVAPIQSGKKKPARRRTARKEPKQLEASETSPLVSRDVPATGARAVMIIDAHSGQVLYEKNADERGFLDRPVRVEAIDAMCEPVKLNIRSGETYQRIDLLRALLVKSPNDVARCLARDYAGSVEAFATVMNQRARELGATQSHFVNPNGLPVAGQYSTARDLSIIARAAYANPTIRSIVCMPQIVFRYANGRTRELENTNKVLRRSPYCNGMKTGYTEAAGHCLIASGSRPGRDVIVVVLGDSKAGVWRDASALLSWGLWM